MSYSCRVTSTLVLPLVSVILTGSVATAQMKPRPAWTNSRITGSPLPPRPYRSERVFKRLTFTNPVVLAANKELRRWFVVEVTGKIKTFPLDHPNPTQADLAIDLSKIKGMRQAYGLAFHPKFAQNRFVYISYVLAANLPHGTRVSRFVVKPTNPPTIDQASEKTIITWLSGGHNGACLQFGPDGYLYVTAGDGGPAFPPDPRKSGQDVSTVLSTVMRIDVDRPTKERAYSIPADNPFVNMKGARGEIWAYGFRNPWKLTFDRKTGAMWIADVGWEMWEMVYRVQKAGNYGWSLREGPQRVHRERPRGPTPILPATVAHSHTESRSITGGHVYHGDRLPQLRGYYIYGDYVTGKVWGVRHDGKRVTSLQELVDTAVQLVCFGIDPQGEVLLVGYDGTIHRLVSNTATKSNKRFPRQLSQTGLYRSLRQLQLAPGVVSYKIQAEPWLDGAHVQRLVGLPGQSKLGEYTKTNVQIGTIAGKWHFPKDGVLARTISLEMEQGNPRSRRKLETQVLHYDGDTWQAYNYIWNDRQDDAVLDSGTGSDRYFEIKDANAPGGKRKQKWHFASRSECLLCHTTRAGSIHGFIPQQLSLKRRFGDQQLDQLQAFNHMGLFHKTPKKAKTLANPHDESLPLESRARSYLHVNCGHCHRRGGGGTAAFDVRFEFNLQQTLLLDRRPTQGTFGIHNAKTVASGDPSRSVLLYRMMKLGRGRMPHFGSEVVDQRGVNLMYRWIASMKGGKQVAASRKLPQQWVSQLGTSHRGQAIRNLLRTTNGAVELAHAVAARDKDIQLRKIATTAALARNDIRIRDLFDRFLPEEQRTQRLGSQVQADVVLKLRGDASAGKKLFLTAAGVACKNCHQIAGQGRKLGPDLTKLSKDRKKAEVLTSILQPSKKIDPKYQTYLLETSGGQVLTGLLQKKTAKTVVLLTAEGKKVTVPAAEVELLLPQQKSLMPELLFKDLTAQQLADLLAYLMQPR